MQACSDEVEKDSAGVAQVTKVQGAAGSSEVQQLQKTIVCLVNKWKRVWVSSVKRLPRYFGPKGNKLQEQTQGKLSNARGGTTFRPQRTADGRPIFFGCDKASHIRRDYK
ncbi:hypothetical protein PR048_013259 [Dryococelus australis]|uniref:Uncharacterized protein n=1 Tax=Dryococelus australis TaxID=614101 RepID=A0ABQ9HRN3_9NEOP|nr:hypothetical protein PR048_013259 [Dryococelus australis]